MLLSQISAPYLMLFIATAVGAISVPIYNVNQVTYRHALIDVRLQGRVNATIRTFVWGTTLLGSRTILSGSLVAGLAALWLIPFRERRSDEVGCALL